MGAWREVDGRCDGRASFGSALARSGELRRGIAWGWMGSGMVGGPLACWIIHVALASLAFCNLSRSLPHEMNHRLSVDE